MENRIGIARQLVKIAKELVGATVHIDVDFSDDEAAFKEYCNSNGYGFSSDNGAVYRVFTISTMFGDVEVRSDLVDGDRIAYDVYCDSYSHDGCESLKETLHEVDRAEIAMEHNLYENLVETFKSALGPYASEIEAAGGLDDGNWSGPVIYVKISGEGNLAFVFSRDEDSNLFGYTIEQLDEEDNWSPVDIILEKSSFGTPEEAIRSLVVDVKKAAEE